jgi:protein-tyrosine phosphatase
LFFMKQAYSREIKFEGILNFRDLGGYQAGNKTVAWRRLFRSGELHCMTTGDMAKIKNELKVNTIIDLRGSRPREYFGVGLVKEMGGNYYNMPMVTVDDYFIERKLSRNFSNLHDEYLFRVKNKGYGQRFVEVLNIIADPSNHPLIFHCNAGADRSGLLSAMLLDILGVGEDDIEADYGLTQNDLPKFIDRWNNNPATADIHKNLPEYQLKLNPKAITALLATLRQEYGSIQGYLESFGADKTLFTRLEKALLI